MNIIEENITFKNQCSNEQQVIINQYNNADFKDFFNQNQIKTIKNKKLIKQINDKKFCVFNISQEQLQKINDSFNIENENCKQTKFIRIGKNKAIKIEKNKIEDNIFNKDNLDFNADFIHFEDQNKKNQKLKQKIQMKQNNNIKKNDPQGEFNNLSIFIDDQKRNLFNNQNIKYNVLNSDVLLYKTQDNINPNQLMKAGSGKVRYKLRNNNNNNNENNLIQDQNEINLINKFKDLNIEDQKIKLDKKKTVKRYFNANNLSNLNNINIEDLDEIKKYNLILSKLIEEIKNIVSMQDNEIEKFKYINQLIALNCPVDINIENIIKLIKIYNENKIQLNKDLLKKRQILLVNLLKLQNIFDCCKEFQKQFKYLQPKSQEKILMIEKNIDNFQLKNNFIDFNLISQFKELIQIKKVDKTFLIRFDQVIDLFKKNQFDKINEYNEMVKIFFLSKLRKIQYTQINDVDVKFQNSIDIQLQNRSGILKKNLHLLQFKYLK